MKKGFTLIELLAVIVILAIIAVIAVPIVLNIINDTKENAVLRSADFYLDGVEKSIATSILKNIQISDGTYSIMEDGNVCIGTLSNNICTGDVLKVEMDGEMPTEGSITIKDGQIKKVDLTISDKEIWTDPFTNKLDYKLAPGLYDENDKLLVSWDELVDKYDFKNVLEQNYIDEYADDGKGFAASIIESNYNDAYKLIIDENVSNIGSYAFYGCASLTEIIIPEGVTTIGVTAFGESESLTKITIPSSVTSIGDSAFWGCTSLTSITIPNSVTSIGGAAFIGSGLTSITIPSSVTSIEDSTFMDCYNLVSVIIPEGVITIEDNAFVGSGLTSITIPSSVTSISQYAFTGCKNLINIKVDSNNPVYDSRDNSNAIIKTASNALVAGCKNTTIPSSVTYIGDYAFDGSGLTSITIPSSVTSIGDSAFSYSTLTTVIIEEGVKSIGSRAFGECPNLTTITIPSSVTNIGYMAFEECPNLTTIYYKGTATGKPWGAPNATVVRDF